LKSISDIIYPASAWFSQVLSRYGNTNDPFWIPDPEFPTDHNYGAMTWSYVTNEMGRMVGTFDRCFFANKWDGIYPSGDAIELTFNNCTVDVDPTFTGTLPHGIKANLGAKVWFNNGKMIFRTNALNGGYSAVVQADSTNAQYITGQLLTTQVILDGPTIYNTNSATIPIDAPVGSVAGWYVDASNLVSTVLSSYPQGSFASSSNTLALKNDFVEFTATTNVSVTNVSGQGVGQYVWGTLFVSNSSAGTIAGFVTAPNARPIGSLTTNGLAIPPGKMGVFSFVSLFGKWTNFCNAVQQ
jgi:hypothetical protein